MVAHSYVDTVACERRAKKGREVFMSPMQLLHPRGCGLTPPVRETGTHCSYALDIVKDRKEG